MSFSKHNVYAMIIVSLVVLYATVLSRKFAIYDSYLGRAFLAILIISLTYFNTWFGIVAVFATIAIFGFSTVEPFVSENKLFEQQNHLQKKVYYVPKRSAEPIPQNDTDYVPLNPMQSKAGAVQPSQPAKVVTTKHAPKPKSTGNNYQHILRIQEMVRPKSSKSMPSTCNNNAVGDPQSNWPDNHAFKNPYSIAEK